MMQKSYIILSFIFDFNVFELFAIIKNLFV